MNCDEEAYWRKWLRHCPTEPAPVRVHAKIACGYWCGKVCLEGRMTSQPRAAVQQAKAAADFLVKEQVGL